MQTLPDRSEMSILRAAGVGFEAQARPEVRRKVREQLAQFGERVRQGSPDADVAREITARLHVDLP